jgi:hypothetical protein
MISNFLRIATVEIVSKSVRAPISNATIKLGVMFDFIPKIIGNANEPAPLSFCVS